MTAQEETVYRLGRYDIRTLTADSSALAYGQRGWHEEFVSAFFRQLATDLKPGLLIDVGANYGVYALIMKHSMPDTPLIAIEPNRDIAAYIGHNLGAASFKGFEVHEAIAGDETRDGLDFHLNPAGSQDSRVAKPHEDWTAIPVRQIALDDLLADRPSDEPVFIKIDVQGYEHRVFKGAERFLDRGDSWLIKTEFGPAWLESQGTDPEAFLSRLVRRYWVAEYPARFCKGDHYRDVLRRQKINPASVSGFVRYARRLNRHDKGWVDLLVAPKSSMQDAAP